MSYHSKTHTNFHDNVIPKEGSQCVCVLILIECFKDKLL